jgi:uncharacterized protein (DUF2344 family)
MRLDGYLVHEFTFFSVFFVFDTFFKLSLYYSTFPHFQQLLGCSMQNDSHITSCTGVVSHSTQEKLNLMDWILRIISIIWDYWVILTKSQESDKSRYGVESCVGLCDLPNNPAALSTSVAIQHAKASTEILEEWVRNSVHSEMLEEVKFCLKNSYFLLRMLKKKL